MSGRVFSQDEMASILERVAELQAQQSRNSDSAGLTLDELEEAAVEAGLDSSLLRQAVSEFEIEKKFDGIRSSDTSATHNFENRWIDGAIDDHAWEELVFELKHRFDSDSGKALGMPGYGLSSTQSFGNSHEWKHTSMTGVETKFLVRSKKGSTRVSASQKVGMASKITESIMYGSIVTIFVTLIAAAATESAILTTLITLATLMIVIPLIYAADKAWRNKKHLQLQKLTDTAVSILTNGAREEAATAIAQDIRVDTKLRATEPHLLKDLEKYGQDSTGTSASERIKE